MCSTPTAFSAATSACGPPGRAVQRRPTMFPSLTTTEPTNGFRLVRPSTQLYVKNSATLRREQGQCRQAYHFFS